MNIEEYYQREGSKLSFTRQQASDFAKNVAGDFNPIHDVDSKRFCVPGDLLFSVIIHHYGLRQNMIFNFSGMVGDQVTLILPDKNTDAEHLALLDENGKKYLAMECDGNSTTNEKLIESLTRHYVEFSGQAFLDIIVPLMSEQKVMINPDRPLIIYESMSLQLQTLDIDNVNLKLSKKTLKAEGKRGGLTLEYDLLSDGVIIGRGCKRMVLSGLRDYDEQSMKGLTDYYENRKVIFSNL